MRRTLLATLFFLGTTTRLLAADLSFDVRETAGIRRFDYPATARLTLPEASSSRLVLTHNGKPISAQIAPHPDNSRQVTIDFKVTCAPHETQHFELKPDNSTAPTKPPTRTITATRDGNDWLVVGTNALTYRIPGDLKGFVSSVRHDNSEWLRDNSPGITLTSRSGKSCTLGSNDFPVSASRVLRQGSHCCELEFKAAGATPDWQDVSAVVTLTFPLAKSWFELNLAINDPADRLASASPRPELSGHAQTAPRRLRRRRSDLPHAHRGPGE
ncbi:MAG: hypothetical protein U0903_17790 [Planctomycetales bacterium]